MGEETLKIVWNNMRPEIKKYNEADVQRYIDQKMSPEEMYAFEKALAADPFLSDVVDGWMAANPTLQNKHLLELTNRVTGSANSKEAAPIIPIQQENKPVRSLPWFRQTWFQAAAAFILIAGLAWVVFNRYVNNRSSDAITASDKLNEEELAYSAPLEPANDESSVNIPLDNPVNVPVEPPSQSEKIEPQKEQASINSTPSNNYIPPVVNQSPKNISANQPTTASRSNRTRTAKTNPAEFNEEEVSVQNASATKQGNSILYTPSTGQPYKPVTNVSNNQQASQQPATVPQVKTQQVAPSPQPAPKYDYDSTYGPLTGWHAYITYLESETRKRQNLAQRGVVKLYFNIDNRGRPIDIDVTGDQSPELRQLALDILNNGAGWRRITEQGKMSLTVHFK